MNNIIRYFFRSSARHFWLTFLLVGELIACCILGSISFALLEQNYKDTDYYFEGIEDYYRECVSLDAFEDIGALDIDEKIGVTYPMHTRDSLKVNISGTKEVDMDVIAISGIMARFLNINLVDGDRLEHCGGDEYPIIISKTIAHQYGRSVGDVYPVHFVDVGDVSHELRVRVVGIGDDSSPNYNTVEYGQYYDMRRERCYILMPNGDISLWNAIEYTGSYAEEHTKEEQIARASIMCLFYNCTDDELLNLSRMIGDYPDSIGDMFYAQYQDDYYTNLGYILAFVGSLIFMISTLLTSIIVMLKERLKENSLVYVLGLSRRQLVGIEVCKYLILLIVPIILSGILIGATLELNIFQQNGSMKYFFTVTPIIAVIYLVVNAISLVSAIRTQPLDGLKEE